MDVKKIDIANLVQDYAQSGCFTDEELEKFATSQILAIPDNLSEDGYCYSRDSLDLIKYFRNSTNGGHVDILYTQNQQKHYSFHSFDLYLPILIIEKIFIPTVIGLLTSYIYDKIRGYEDQKPMVKSKLILKEGDTQLELSYEGDAETFCKTLLELREVGKI